MKFSLKKNILFIFVVAILFSCDKKEDNASSMLKQVEALPEFQLVEKRIDSLKRNGIKASVGIMVAKGSLFSENDSSKDISTIIISEDL